MRCCKVSIMKNGQPGQPQNVKLSPWSSILVLSVTLSNTFIALIVFSFFILKYMLSVQVVNKATIGTFCNCFKHNLGLYIFHGESVCLTPVAVLWNMTWGIGLQKCTTTVETWIGMNISVSVYLCWQHWWTCQSCECWCKNDLCTAHMTAAPVRHLSI